MASPMMHLRLISVFCCLLAGARGFALPPHASARSARPSHAAAPPPTVQQLKSSFAAAAAALLISTSTVPVATAVPAAMAAPPAAAVAKEESSSKTPGRRYINLTGFPFPLGPFTERRTVQTEIVPGKVYSFEQQQKLSGITANVRSVVFRMKDNHLLVYNPVAPTDEFVRQLDALGHDGVSHILLGATTYEHKIFVGPFARKFPEAQVWAVPDQWSFPLDLPAPALGVSPGGGKLGVRSAGGGELLDTATAMAAHYPSDFTSEFEVKLLRPKQRLGFGYAANEAALLHKDTKTLALTDALVNVPRTAPAIYDADTMMTIGDNRKDSNTLGNLILKAAGAVNWRGTARADVDTLFAKSGGDDPQEQLQRGWERNALLSLYFGPSPKTIVDPDASFQSLQSKWIVAPVTDKLIYKSSKVKPELKRWVEDVAAWEFTTIAPAHFDVRPGTAADLKAAFAPTLAESLERPAAGSLPYNEGDVGLLDDLAGGLIKVGVI